jgi:hypothetical protein
MIKPLFSIYLNWPHINSITTLLKIALKFK